MQYHVARLLRVTVAASLIPLSLADTVVAGEVNRCDSSLLRRGHWHPSQLDQNDASEPEQMEFPFDPSSVLTADKER